MAILCYLSFLVIIPLLTEAKNESFVKFHIKQGLVLLIASLVVSLLGSVIPVLGWFIIAPVGAIWLTILMIMGIINAANGAEKELPTIGKYGDKFNI